MKTPIDIIIELESDNSRLFKESIIIREMKNNNIDFFDGVRFACDKLITFGVAEKSIPQKIKTSEFDFDHVSFTEFKSVLQKLVNRELTGNSAKDALLEICNKTSAITWTFWYRRILLKDLKCGVDAKTINNCAKKSGLQKFSIPVFSCQLAFDSNLHEKKMCGKKLVDVKLDGSRILTIVYPNGKVDQFSRQGKEIVNFPHIKNQFSECSSSLPEPMVFDGEMMSSSFQDLMTQFYRQENVDTKNSNLYLFDIIPLKEFQKGIYKEKQINRLEKLHLWIKQNKNILEHVKTLEYDILDLDDFHDRKKFNDINKLALEEGYEGIMVKDIDAAYECKRSTAWLKLKPVLSLDLEILDMEEGTDKYTGKLGALVCSGKEDGKYIKVNVGSGLTDEEREHYWINKNEMIGKIVEVKYDAITQNKNGEYSLRFPRFHRLRGFEIGEKI